jgi:hypothetical protein
MHGMSEKEKIRIDTEYARARAIIDGIRKLASIGAVIGLVLAVGAIIADQIGIGLAIASGAVSSLIFIILAREALQAVFDIADCALLKNKTPQ